MKNIEDLRISDCLKMVRRRFWYLVVPAFTVTALAAAVIKTLPRVYRSETTVQVSSRLLPEDYIGSIVRETVTDRIDFVKEQIRSRTFVEHIVQEFKLYGDSGHLEDAIDSVTLQIRSGFTLLSPNTFQLAYSTTDAKLSQAVVQGIADRVIALNQTSRRQKAQVADQFLDDQLRQAATELSDAEEKLRAFTERQFQGAAEPGITPEKLNQAEIELKTLQTDLDRTTAERDLTQRRINEQEQLHTVLTTPPPQPDETERQEQVSAKRISEQEQRLTTKRADLQVLLSKYTEFHPDVIRLSREVHDLELQVAQAEKNEPASVDVPKSEPPRKAAATPVLPVLQSSDSMFRAELDLELARLTREVPLKEQALRAQSAKIASYRGRLNPPSAVAEELSTLNRDADAARQRYTLLWTKKLNTEMATSVDSSDENVTFKIIDPPNLPQRAASPNRRMLALVGGLIGVVVGLVIAFVREALDSTMHDQEETAAQLKLPVLAAIPKVAIPKKRATSAKRDLPSIAPAADVETIADERFSLKASDAKLRSVVSDPASIAGAEFRMISANLSMMQKQRSIKSLLILSPFPNEGKTFSACSLAAILAQESQGKVLLIDADLRTGSASKMLGLVHDQMVSGLSAVLRGKAGIDRGILKCINLNLCFLPSGPNVDNPAELLNLPDLKLLLDQLSTRFAWVIIDAPPVLVADSVYLIPHCDAVLMVVRAEQTPLKAIDDSIQRIGRERICGVLLNDVRTAKTPYYYHYQNPPRAVASNGRSRH
jgi:polysaccharide chain length determinant protein (PEP-CTERM system associated)